MMLYVEKPGREDLTRTEYPSDALDTLNRALSEKPLILLDRFVHNPTNRFVSKKSKTKKSKTKKRSLSKKSSDKRKLAGYERFLRK
jgi:hypothetical protein